MEGGKIHNLLPQGAQRNTQGKSLSDLCGLAFCETRTTSNPHRHHDIPILIIVALSRPQLTRGLRIL